MNRPIIFSAPMVRALLEGRKTQTRRVLTSGNTLLAGRSWGRDWDETWDWANASPVFDGREIEVTRLGYSSNWGGSVAYRVVPSFQPGDLLYVRESHHVWCAGNNDGTGRRIDYRATTPDAPCTWSPSIHMPRWASRLTLAVTDVRVEKLNEISEDDAIAEGVLRGDPLPNIPASNGPIWHSGIEATLDDGFAWTRQPVMAFRDLWSSIHGPGAWDLNPWVVAVTFTAHKINVDQFAGAGNSMEPAA
jgi:hypothetical protein